MKGAEVAAAATDLIEELRRTKLFSERQFQFRPHLPNPFATPENYKELAELVGELGKPTLLGYLSEREKLEQTERAVMKKRLLRGLIDRKAIYLLQRPKEEGPAKTLVISLKDDRFKYLDTRSENQVVVDDVEDLLEGKKKPWHVAETGFSWESQAQWFIDAAEGPSHAKKFVSDAVVAMTFALAGSISSRPLKSWKEFRDKTDAEETVSSAEGESHETSRAADPIRED